MAVLALFSHPIWFTCSLVLSVVLWIRRRRGWSPDVCPVDLTGKTAVVTGASTGIGKWIARDLARRNARTVLACRSRERGEAALEEIRRATGNPQVHLRLLDTSSVASVRAFARQFLAEERRLDILVNNAGASGLPHRVTEEGLELLFATNALGPFLLTNLLLDIMKTSAPARVVNVSSYIHYKGDVNVKFLTGEERPKGASNAYSSTKLMNIVFTSELARRLRGTGVSVNAVHPGVVKTEIMRDYAWWMRLLFSILGTLFLKTPKEGATSALYCAVSREVEGVSGKYFDSDCSLTLPLALAEDPAVGRKLWDAAEAAIGLASRQRE
nr:retinol dehydrogenase 11-like [Pogona vitticeps]